MQRISKLEILKNVINNNRANSEYPHFELQEILQAMEIYANLKLLKYKMENKNEQTRTNDRQ